MSIKDKDALFQELLEYHYGCHPDPERIEVRLGEDPEVRALLEEAQRTAETLSEAAHEPGLAQKLALAAPVPKRLPGPWGRRLRVAASILVALALLGPMAHWGYRAWEQKRLESEQVRLVVSGPPSYPAGTAGRFRIETWDPGNQPRLATVSWRVLDEKGAVLEGRTETCDGTLELALTPRLEGAASLEVEAEAGGKTVATVFNLGQDKTPPLVHLSTDKPAYRPGETAFLRAAILDRLTLRPRTGTYWLRVIDAKGSPVMQTTAPAKEGVAALEWSIPENASGGRYVFEVRDGTNAFTVESLELLVRRFQPPRLAKKLDLDRETYAPGERGSAEIEVSRLGGGVPAGAPVQATLLVDGEKVWEKAGHLDAEGRAIMSFVVPEKVERGAGRFVAKITDGGVVETEIEPFVIPTGRLEVAFHPEGGDLVAGVRNRVYVEITDTLGRPASATGRIVDASGREVARLHTLHQGRGRIEMTPEAGAAYRLEFDEPKAPAAALPGARPSGVVLRSESDFTAAGAPLRIGVHTPGGGPWIVGAFCRGSLVAQDTFSGAGEHALGLDIPDNVAGVLRVTVFDANLKPLAERLVHRESGRRLQVALEPKSPVAAPGEKQEIEILVTDETGKPVRTVLGLTVTDRAVRDMLDEHRVGIEDQAWLVADVEDLEDIEEFVAGDAESRRNIDLVLGNRGWRRFAWVDPVAFVAEYGDQGKALLLREGHAQVPVVSDTGIRHGRLLTEARHETREAKELALSVLAIVLAAGGLFLVGSLLWMLSGKLLPPGGSLRSASRGTIVALGLVIVVFVLQIPLRHRGLAPGMLADDARVFQAAEAGAMPAPDAAALEAPGLDATVNVDGFVLNLAEGVEFRELPRAGDVDADGALDVALAIPVDQLGVLAGDEHAEPGAPEGDAPVAAVAAAREAPAGEPLPWDPVAQPNPVVPEAVREIDDLVEEEVVADPAVGLIAASRYWHHYRTNYAYTRIYAHQRKPSAARDDFTETVYWNAALVTDAAGKARVAFDLSDSVTTWSIHADAHGGGRIGQKSASFETRVPFQMAAVIPAEVSDGDRLQIPVALTAYPDIANARIGVSTEGALRIDGDAKTLSAVLEQGRGRVLVPLVVAAAGEPSRIFLSGDAAGWRDRVTRQVRVVPRGFPRHLSQSGVVTDSASHVLPVPEQVGAGSLGLVIKLYPSPLATLADGMEGMLRQPSGCFEQASSSNYPNVLALQFMEAVGSDAPALATRSRQLLEGGYRKIAGYECSERGYEWFGGNPGHEALTAYGLLEFHDMAKVYPEVDPEMVQRTRGWLMKRRDGRGGYERNARALDSFGRAPQPIGDAYATYALAVTGDSGEIRVELDHIQTRAAESEDPYEVALAAGALAAAGRADAADAARERLKTMQREDGGLVGTTTSITSSGGADLAVETTSFAILAWLEDPADGAHVESAMRFLMEHRSGYGTFGATQATIMAMKALCAYTEKNYAAAKPGTVEIRIDGKEVARREIAGGAVEPILFEDLATRLTPGENRLEIVTTGGNRIPYAVDLRYHAEKPADDPDAALDLETRLSAETVREGDTVSLEVKVTNRRDAGCPMSMAIVGLPAGLEAPTKVLDDLKKAESVDFWELRGRDLVFYWRDLAPHESKQVQIDLLARVPGTTTGPASRAYLYYTPDSKRWAEPLSITVQPAER